MSTTLRQALGAVVLLALLTVLLIGTMDSGAAGHDRAARTLENLAHAEAALQRDILLVRSGALRNYDPLVADVRSITASLGALRGEVEAARLDPGPEQALAAAAGRQADLVEHLKTGLALLRNSLSYIPILAAQAAALSTDRALDAPVGALSGAILRLVLDTSPPVVQAAQDRLDALARWTLPPGPQSDTRTVLLRHGQLLIRLMPQVDGELHELVAVPIQALGEPVQQQLQVHQQGLQRRAATFRAALYAVSLVLLVRLVLVGLRLRASRLALQERAAVERLAAQVSTGFVGCRHEHVGAYLTTALGTIGQALGLERVYVVQPDPQGVRLWTRLPDPMPPGWPAAAAEVAQDAPATNGVRAVASTQRLQAGRARERLDAAGVRSWAGFELVDEAGPLGLLGFDAAAPDAICPHSGADSLRSIGQVIEQALRSEHAFQEREALQSRLRQAQRLETAGTMASGVAHNLNNIVAAVLGHAEMALDRLPGETPAAQHVDEIRRAGERARDLVDRMLRFGRRDGVSRETVSVRALVTETVSLLRVALPPGVSLTTAVDGGEAPVVGEPAQLQQVIVNLLRNAVQAVGERGQVRLSLDAVDAARAWELTLGGVKPGPYVRLSVSDTGHGMDAETRGRIFEPFFTTRPAGTGLGLATVADIVRDHGGALDVSSAPGTGTLFEVWLPRNAAEPVVDQPRRGQGEIVLVIDGDRARLLKTEDTLAALGYEPAGFSDEGEAVEALRRAPRHFDAVLLDTTRSGEHAGEAVASVRAISAELPLVLVCDAGQAARLGRLPGQAVEVVTRPVTSAGLAAALSRSLGRALDIASSDGQRSGP